MQGVISILLWLLCNKILSILENVPWAAEKNVYCAVARWHFLQTSVKYILSIVLGFRSRIFLLTFCLDYLLIDDRGVLKSTTTVLASVCAFKSFSVSLMKLGALTLGTYRLIIVISFWCIAPFINVSLMSTLSDKSIATPACFGEPLAC
jgi:hypothetical protein